jgi:TRAP-type C4-dicarboxylate transport system substrate-binding protein
MPGLFRDTREASLVHTRLVAQKALRGYEDFFTIGAVATQPETIHSRKRTASLADIEGQKLRVNNSTAGAGVAKLGASFLVLPLNDTANAISSGTVDGAVVQLAQLGGFGVGRVVSHHYLLPTGSAPLALVMNRKVFDGLPEPARQLIRDHSGEWLAARYTEISDDLSLRVLKELRADARRKVVDPSPQDRAAAQHVFDRVADEWAAASPYNRDLLQRAKAEIATIRSSKELRP